MFGRVYTIPDRRWFIIRESGKLERVDTHNRRYNIDEVFPENFNEKGYRRIARHVIDGLPHRLLLYPERSVTNIRYFLLSLFFFNIIYNKKTIIVIIIILYEGVVYRMFTTCGN